jgi:hypothetical protein
VALSKYHSKTHFVLIIHLVNRTKFYGSRLFAARHVATVALQFAGETQIPGDDANTQNFPSCLLWKHVFTRIRILYGREWHYRVEEHLPRVRFETLRVFTCFLAIGVLEDGLVIPQMC